MTRVPFMDLREQYMSIESEIQEAVHRVLRGGRYVLGEEVDAFEREFADHVGAAHGVAVNTGTNALHLALVAAGVGPGDEVITVPHTFIATVAAIEYTGAKAVLVDIEPDSYTMDPTRLPDAITERTKAIMPVHLYGHPAPLDPILDIAERHGLTVVEDAAQAHGAEYRGRRCGGIGQLAGFSFYPSKNLGAYGEGGFVAAADQAAADTVRMLRDWGQDGKYHYRFKGFNARMDAIQAAMLRVKLRHLEGWTEARRERAGWYVAALRDCPGVSLPLAEPESRHVYHCFVVRVKSRDAFRTELAKRGIDTAVHYPEPIHLTDCYRDLGYKSGDFPHAERAADEVVSLPLFPEMSKQQVDTVVNAVREVCLS